MFQRILLAWDGSTVARRASDVAIDLSRRYDVELVTLSIAHSPPHAETESDRAGVSVEHDIVVGDEPHALLPDYCHEHGFDLIVTGHHREGRVGLLLQGVAMKLVATATVPVLVVGEHEQ